MDSNWEAKIGELEEEIAKLKGQAKPDKLSGFHIVRTYSAGVFFGKIEKREGKEVTMSNARRIWYWDGAASLSQLALSGTSKPEKCKFPEAVPEVLLLEAIEILACTEKAAKSITEVPVWKK